MQPESCSLARQNHSSICLRGSIPIPTLSRRLIRKFLRVCRSATILGPTYAEHARAALLAGHQVETVCALEPLSEADLAIVVNPNNPDGTVF